MIASGKGIQRDLDSGDLNYGFQSLVGFRIPATRIPDFWEIVNAETRNVFE